MNTLEQIVERFKSEILEVNTFTRTRWLVKINGKEYLVVKEFDTKFGEMKQRYYDYYEDEEIEDEKLINKIREVVK